jgi:S1-C subfamily serine protease
MDLADHTRGKAAHSVVVVNKVAPESPVEASGIRKYVLFFLMTIIGSESV